MNIGMLGSGFVADCYMQGLANVKGQQVTVNYSRSRKRAKDLMRVPMAALPALLAARPLAAGPTRGFVRPRQAIAPGMQLSFDASLDLERDYQRELGRSADYREGVAAFMEKRAPRFTGQ